MALAPGTRIGVFEIIVPLGAGGMGEVYRARDTRLERDVALKILPAAFASDADRVARFQREAKTLATLNHPHIAQIYGLEQSEGMLALAMELVAGEDLADRLARGPIPVDDALTLARQIADALDAAHTAGVIHRDLKPANIKVRDDGTLKLLDFGLAKALDAVDGHQESAGSQTLPTITTPAMTQAGVILGTAAYMSPEQARGKAVDRRTDLWAFGCVLYEMLTGARAFDGETITDVLSAIVRAEPDWSKLPREMPAIVDRLLHRCLVKDARNRQQSAGDVRIEIEEALAGAAKRSENAAVAIPGASRRRWVPALGVAAAAAMAASAATWLWARANVEIPDRPPLRFTIDLPRGAGVVNPAVSRDGRSIAIGTRDELGRQQIWVRAFDGVAFEPVPGATGGVSPFWSADGTELGFFNAGKLMRIAARGGTPREVVDLGRVLGATPNGSLPANWGADGTILLGTVDGVYRVPVEGGEPARIAAGAETSTGPLSSYSWPFVLPDHNALLYTAITGGNLGDGALMFQTLAGGAPIRLRANRTRAHYTPDGLLLARLNGAEGLGRASLTVHRFDPAQPAVEEPGVELSSDASLNFGASDTGVIVYMPARANADYRFEWVDASGRPTGDGFSTLGSNPFNLSRDEHLLAFVESGDIFLRDLRRGVTTRLVAGPAVLEPILSPDGGRIAYSVTGGSERGIAVRPTAGGASQLVYKSEQAILVEDWSPDGRFLAANGGGSGLIIPLDTGQAQMVYASLSPGVNPDEPRFSPDGRWLVYNAADSGRQEVYPGSRASDRGALATLGGRRGARPVSAGWEGSVLPGVDRRAHGRGAGDCSR